MKTFEEFLLNKCQNHTNNSQEGYERWLENRDIDEMISYADEYNNKSLTDYHNHIVEKVNTLNAYNGSNTELPRYEDDMWVRKSDILFLLQDTNL